MAQTNLTTNQAIFNAVRLSLDDNFQARIPAAEQASLDTQITVLFANEFSNELNDFATAILNKVAMTIIDTGAGRNRLARFKKQGFTYGEFVEEIVVDLRKSLDPRPDYTGYEDPFVRAQPKIHAMYHRINNLRAYQTTVSRKQLRRAFRQEGGLASLLEAIVAELYESNTWDEFLLSKELFSQYLNNPKVALRPDQIEATIPAPVDDTTALSFYKDLFVKSQYMSMTSRNFNPTQIAQASDAPGMTLLTLPQVSASLRADLQAYAFNDGKVTPNIETVILDDFGTNNTSCYAALIDNRLLQIREIGEKVFESIKNPRNLYYNYYLHVEEMYSLSYFRNCIFWTDNAIPYKFGVNVSSTIDLTDKDRLESLGINPDRNDVTDDEVLAAKIDSSAKASKSKTTIDPDISEYVD